MSALLQTRFYRLRAVTPPGEARFLKSCPVNLTDIAGRSGAACAEFGHEISRQVSVNRVHRCLVGGGGAEPNKAVRPHEDGAAIGHASLSRIELCACSIHNRDELTPAGAEMVQARRRTKHDQMVACSTQPVASREALSR